MNHAAVPAIALIEQRTADVFQRAFRLDQIEEQAPFIGKRLCDIQLVLEKNRPQTKRQDKLVINAGQAVDLQIAGIDKPSHKEHKRAVRMQNVAQLTINDALDLTAV